MAATRRGKGRQSGGGTIWSALNRIMLGLIVVVVFVGIGLAFVPVIKNHSQLRAQLRKLQLEIANLEDTLKREETKLKLLKTDPEYVETIARDKLDVMREGETIFRLDIEKPRSVPD